MYFLSQLTKNAFGSHLNLRLLNRGVHGWLIYNKVLSPHHEPSTTVLDQRDQGFVWICGATLLWSRWRNVHFYFLMKLGSIWTFCIFITKFDKFVFVISYFWEFLSFYHHYISSRLFWHYFFPYWGKKFKIKKCCCFLDVPETNVRVH